MLWRITLTALLATLFLGCSTRGNPAYSKRAKQSHQSASIPYKEQKRESSHAKKISQSSVTKKLMVEYKKWNRSDYEYGGTDMRGVDCSSLVQNIYEDAFGISIPRSTKEQSAYGRRVGKNELRDGDLIFFKTGYNERHVGILVNGDEFIHASTSSGVIISKLDNPYWKMRYWQARRVLP